MHNLFFHNFIKLLLGAWPGQPHCLLWVKHADGFSGEHIIVHATSRILKLHNYCKASPVTSLYGSGDDEDGAGATID